MTLRFQNKLNSIFPSFVIVSFAPETFASTSFVVISYRPAMRGSSSLPAVPAVPDLSTTDSPRYAEAPSGRLEGAD